MSAQNLGQEIDSLISACLPVGTEAYKARHPPWSIKVISSTNTSLPECKNPFTIKQPSGQIISDSPCMNVPVMDCTFEKLDNCCTNS